MTAINPAILETVLTRLALLFLAGAAGDATAARLAATQMLTAYAPETANELSLAAEIISFHLHALEALAQAADPDLSLTRTLRLRGSAVSLSREAHKAQRKLDQLCHARRAEPQPAQVQPVPEPQATPQRDPQPAPDMAVALAEAQRVAKQTIARDGGKTWSQTLQKRFLATRMAEKVKKHQAKQAALLNKTASALDTLHQHA